MFCDSSATVERDVVVEHVDCTDFFGKLQPRRKTVLLAGGCVYSFIGEVNGEKLGSRLLFNGARYL